MLVAVQLGLQAWQLHPLLQQQLLLRLASRLAVACTPITRPSISPPASTPPPCQLHCTLAALLCLTCRGLSWVLRQRLAPLAAEEAAAVAEVLVVVVVVVVVVAAPFTHWHQWH